MRRNASGAIKRRYLKLRGNSKTQRMKLFKRKNSEFENGQKIPEQSPLGPPKQTKSKQTLYGQSTRAQFNGIPNICSQSISQ